MTSNLALDDFKMCTAIKKLKKRKQMSPTIIAWVLEIRNNSLLMGFGHHTELLIPHFISPLCKQVNGQFEESNLLLVITHNNSFASVRHF